MCGVSDRRYAWWGPSQLHASNIEMKTFQRNCSRRPSTQRCHVDDGAFASSVSVISFELLIYAIPFYFGGFSGRC